MKRCNERGGREVQNNQFWCDVFYGRPLEIPVKNDSVGNHNWNVILLTAPVEGKTQFLIFFLYYENIVMCIKTSLSITVVKQANQRLKNSFILLGR